jgi:hypothetical protein
VQGEVVFVRPEQTLADLCQADPVVRQRQCHVRLRRNWIVLLRLAGGIRAGGRSRCC